MAGVYLREEGKHKQGNKGLLYGGVEAAVKRPGLQALRCQVFLASAEAEEGRVNAPSGTVWLCQCEFRP